MEVGRYNYPSQFPDLPELLEEIGELLRAGHYVLSPELRTFEREFSDFCNVRFARGVNSGTDAILIALRSLGIGAGDEVITQANTFHATVAAIVLSGAHPVLVDADEETFLIDVARISATMTSRTRAIIPVHLYGKPVPMREILALADKKEVYVVEDAAQAHGAAVNGQRVGSFGVAGCFSFHPSKNLAAAGDGGAITTSDPSLVETIDLQRGLGQAGQNNHIVIGMNTKLDTLQACILRRKLRYLDQWNQRRERIAESYRKRLCDLPVSFQATSPDETHVFHLFQMRTPHRNALFNYLNERGVDAVVRYPVPIHLQPAFSKFGWVAGQFPVAEALAQESLCLPIRPDMGEAEVDVVVRHVRTFFASAHRAVSNVYSQSAPILEGLKQ